MVWSSSSSRSSSDYNSSAVTSVCIEQIVEVPIEIFCSTFFTKAYDGDYIDRRLHAAYDEHVRCISTTKDLSAAVGRLLNEVTSYCSTPDKGYLNLRFHQQVALTSHPLHSFDEKYRADIAATLTCEPYPDNMTIPWHHVGSLGYVQKSSTLSRTTEKTIRAMEILRQCRPNLVGVYGVAAGHHSVRIMWQDVTGLFSTPDMAWSSPSTLVVLFNYVFGVFRPWYDRTIHLHPDSEKDASRKPMWMITGILGHTYLVEHILSVRTGSNRLSWVARAVQRRDSSSLEFTPCEPVIIKDYWHFDDADIPSESSILEHIHGDGHFLGVCRAIAHIKLCKVQGGTDETVSGSLFTIFASRKHRMVLEGRNDDLYQCPSVLDFFCVMYDTIETLRVLHQDRGVMHFDISLRNIRCSQKTSVTSNIATGSGRFIHQLLSARFPDANVCYPACQIIDFDNAYCEKLSPPRLLRCLAGTVTFQARMISSGFKEIETRRPPLMAQLDGAAYECYCNVHGVTQYNERSTWLNGLMCTFAPIPDDLRFRKPIHDVESCFWVMAHFLFSALPRGCDPTTDDCEAGARACSLMDGHFQKDMYSPRRVVFAFSVERWREAFHPRLASLAEFMREMLLHFHALFEKYDPPVDTYHIHEALQRLLLRQICALLESNDPIPLDTNRRRSFVSIHHPRSYVVKRPVSNDDLSDDDL